MDEHDSVKRAGGSATAKAPPPLPVDAKQTTLLFAGSARKNRPIARFLLRDARGRIDDVHAGRRRSRRTRSKGGNVATNFATKV